MTSGKPNLAQEKIDKIHDALFLSGNLLTERMQEIEIPGYTKRNISYRETIILQPSKDNHLDTIAARIARNIKMPVIILNSKTLPEEGYYVSYVGNSKNAKEPSLDEEFGFAKPSLLRRFSPFR